MALQALASNLVGCYRSQFHSLAPAHFERLDKTFEALGPHSVESLLAGLAREEDWEIRKPFLAFVAARGKASIPPLLRRLSDPSWYLVRNVLLILGDIGDPSTIPSIAVALEHPEPRVRRDAVAALGKIGVDLLPAVVGLGAAGLFAHFCLSNAFRSGDASVVVPLDFLRIPLIAVVGWWLYAEPLDMFVFMGAGLIISGILWNLRSEVRRPTATPLAPAEHVKTG